MSHEHLKLSIYRSHLKKQTHDRSYTREETLDLSQSNRMIVRSWGYIYLEARAEREKIYGGGSGRRRRGDGDGTISASIRRLREWGVVCHAVNRSVGRGSCGGEMEEWEVGRSEREWFGEVYSIHHIPHFLLLLLLFIFFAFWEACLLCVSIVLLCHLVWAL